MYNAFMIRDCSLTLLFAAAVSGVCGAQGVSVVLASQLDRIRLTQRETHATTVTSTLNA
jgi:hypothetical protein